MNKARDKLLLSAVSIAIMHSVNAYEGFDYSAPTVRKSQGTVSTKEPIEDSVFIVDDTDASDITYKFNVFARIGIGSPADAKVTGYGINGNSVPYDTLNKFTYGDPRISSAVEPTYMARSIFGPAPDGEIGFKLLGSNNLGFVFGYIYKANVDFNVTNTFASDGTSCLTERVNTDAARYDNTHDEDLVFAEVGVGSGELKVKGCSKRTGINVDGEAIRIPKKDEVVFHERTIHSRLHGVEFGLFYHDDQYALTASTFVGNNLWDIAPAPFIENFDKLGRDVLLTHYMSNGTYNYIPTYGFSLSLDYRVATIGRYAFSANAHIDYYRSLNNTKYYLTSQSVLRLTGQTESFVVSLLPRPDGSRAFDESSTGKYMKDGVLSNVNYDNYLLFSLGFTMDLAVDT